jgi:hypothetical protein
LGNLLLSGRETGTFAWLAVSIFNFLIDLSSDWSSSSSECECECVESLRSPGVGLLSGDKECFRLAFLSLLLLLLLSWDRGTTQFIIIVLCRLVSFATCMEGHRSTYGWWMGSLGQWVSEWVNEEVSESCDVFSEARPREWIDSSQSRDQSEVTRVQYS